MAEASKRPFWMHQLVEYLLGLALIVMGTQSPTPAVPAITGGLIVLWAACTKSGLSAFNLVPRGAHRFVDPIIILLVVVAATQPWADVEFASRGAMLMIAFIYGFVWLQTSFRGKKAKQPAAAAATAAGATAAPGAAPGAVENDKATDIGRTAGRLAAGGVNAFKRAKAKYDEKSASE